MREGEEDDHDGDHTHRLGRGEHVELLEQTGDAQQPRHLQHTIQALNEEDIEEDRVIRRHIDLNEFDTDDEEEELYAERREERQVDPAAQQQADARQRAIAERARAERPWRRRGD